ncbi:hypothetical protein CTI12_AA092030 [Artemisia annua]|uniref:Uncharacterized protein n=1 Tax=Artemisia annua TaxID=35608 RepID=A0A2U1NIS0_ARTAN|nr:hypothetical protein CTI12_AA092030 [Artemisia annua]
MATINGLHDEILSTILTLLVTSSNGAADLVRLSSTCSRFLDLARQPFILKVVNFHNISMEDYKKHHHVTDLLCLFARAGNLAAECSRFLDLARQPFILKVVNFHNIFMEDYKKHHHVTDLLCLFARAGNLAAESRLGKNADTNGVLIRHKLVTAFIRHASDEELDTNLMSWLLSYIESVLGHDAVFASRMSIAISEMSFYYIQRRLEQNILSKLLPSDTVNVDMPWLKPEMGEMLRENLLAAYDEIFHLSHERI